MLAHWVDRLLMNFISLSRLAWRFGALCLVLFPLLLAAEDSLFVAVGYGGRRISSTDGVHWENDQRWSDVAADDDNVLFNIAYGLNRFVAVGGASVGRMVTTTDGKTWRELPQQKGRVATIVFGHPVHGDAGRFIAGHDGELLWSTDGETFHAGGKLKVEGSVHARRSACGDTEAGFMTVIVGDVDIWAEKRRASWRGSTTDGEAWASQALDTPEARDVAYGAGHFVVVGPKGLIESSHDGQTWQGHPGSAPDDFSRVVWTGERFLVGGGDVVWSSPDGLSWSGAAAIPCSLAFAREKPTPLGMGFSWGGNIWISLDLAAWKKAETPAGPSFEAVARGKHGG